MKTFNIANKFIDFAREENVRLTNAKLVNLIYLANAEYIAQGDKGEKIVPLVDEPLFCIIRGIRIQSLHSICRDNFTTVIEERLQSETEPYDLLSEQIITAIWNIYKRYSSNYMLTMIKADGSPWKKAYAKRNKTNDRNKPVEILNKDIADYYRMLKEE